jgi:hypothetical protein
MTKFRVPVLSFPAFTDIFNTKGKRVGIFISIRLKTTANFFSWGACHHIYVFWLQFEDFLKIMSTIWQNLWPKDARHLASIRNLRKKHWK